MKDYKRLTKRCGNIISYAEPMQSDFIGIIYEEQKKREIMSRLAELEDKIEREEEERKQAVKEFAERIKMAFYYEFDELIPSRMADKIDELVKEVCGDD